MLVKIRDNIFLGDEKVTPNQLKKAGITVILVVGDASIKIQKTDAIMFAVELHKDKVNKPHVKDIACHIPKYMAQNGEIVAILSKTGMVRAAFVVARTICEIENKSIYDVFIELREVVKGFDIGKAYL